MPVAANNKASWYKNPCYKFTVEAATHVVVVLSQPDLRMGNDKQWQSKQKSIGLVVYRTENGKPKKRLKKKDLVLDSTGAIGPFSNNREVVCEPIEPWVESWSYFIVPSTFQARDELDFVVTVSASGPITFHGNVSPSAEAPEEGPSCIHGLGARPPWLCLL